MFYLTLLFCTALLAGKQAGPASSDKGLTEKGLGKTGEAVDKTALATVNGTKRAGAAVGAGAKATGNATVRGAKKILRVTGGGIEKAGETVKGAGR